MYRHEIAAISELVEIRHRGASVRVLITLWDERPRSSFSAVYTHDPEIEHVGCDPEGWQEFRHGDWGVAFLRVAYHDDLLRTFPSVFVDGPREWTVFWEELISHPVIEAARARNCVGNC